MKINYKKSKGITLIALVITIIILVILAGISISALTQTGLFEKAKQTEQKSKEKQEEENTTLETYENKIEQYLGEDSSGSKKLKLVDKVNDGTIKIGDYVKYIPDTVTNTDSKYVDLISELGKYSGSSANTTSTLTQEIDKEKGLNWRVLDITDAGQVRLISDKPTTSKITFGNANGYNNAVKILDDTCITLYTNKQLASKVQNIKIEDIQDKMVEKNYKKIDNSYGTKSSPSSKYYPNVFLKEKEQTLTVGNSTTTGSELGLSEQNELITQTTTSIASSWSLKYTYWVKEMTESDFTDPIYYKLFINDNAYWMSSRCVRLWTNYVNFCIRFVNKYVYATSVYSSYNDVASAIFAFRPVITLNSNVQLDTANSGDGSTPEQGYAIK